MEATSTRLCYVLLADGTPGYTTAPGYEDAVLIAIIPDGAVLGDSSVLQGWDGAFCPRYLGGDCVGATLVDASVVWVRTRGFDPAVNAAIADLTLEFVSSSLAG